MKQYKNYQNVTIDALRFLINKSFQKFGDTLLVQSMVSLLESIEQEQMRKRRLSHDF